MVHPAVRQAILLRVLLMHKSRLKAATPGRPGEAFAPKRTQVYKYTSIHTSLSPLDRRSSRAGTGGRIQIHYHSPGSLLTGRPGPVGATRRREPAGGSGERS
jgi:hypothetical protein